MIRFAALSLAICAIPTGASAQFAAASCLTRAEAEGLVTYSLPGIVRSLSAKCATALPATAPLIQAGPLMAGRYQVEADRAFPIARGAFDKLAGTRMSLVMGDDGTKKMIDSLVSGGMAGKITAADCPAIDRLIDAVQPLPPASMGVLVAALLELQTARNGERKSPIQLCPAAGAAAAASK